MLLNYDEFNKSVQDLRQKNPDLWDTKEYAPEDIVFKAGEAIDNLFFIKDGVFRVYYLNKKSKLDITFDFLFPGQFFLNPMFLLDETPAMFYFEAIHNSISKHSSLYSITAEKWNTLICKSNSDLLLGSLANEVLRRFIFHHLRDKVSSLSKTDILRKMWDEGHSILTSGIKQKYLASFFGVTVEFFNRTISKFLLSGQKEIHKEKSIIKN